MKIGQLNYLALFVAAISLTLLSSCSGTSSKSSKTIDYVDDYLQALKDHQGTAASDPNRLHNFTIAFSDLKSSDLKAALENAYADRLYFNDTIQTHTNRDSLIDYLLKTAEKVESTVVEVQDVSTNENNYYLRWIMTIKFKVSGDLVTSKSVGISHLRLDAEGKVILHQDYWDGVQGIYQHIPYIGYWVKRVRAKL